MLSVIIAASLALKSPPDQRHLLYNEGTCWREKLDIPLLKQASFTMKSPCEAALLNLLYAQHVYGLCSSCRNPGSLNSKAIWGFSQPKREIGTACAQEHHPSPLPRPPDFVHPTIPPLGKYLASKIWNFMIFWKCTAYPNSERWLQPVLLPAFSFLFSINPKSSLRFLKTHKMTVRLNTSHAGKCQSSMVQLCQFLKIRSPTFQRSSTALAQTNISRKSWPQKSGRLSAPIRLSRSPGWW